jgi:hypothetical protein
MTRPISQFNAIEADEQGRNAAASFGDNVGFSALIAGQQRHCSRTSHRPVETAASPAERRPLAGQMAPFAV